ncbi:MAG: N-acetylneuraminate synthase [Bacteroidia bacterium]|nr:N-acetylneuraminate synthase [Bacteroidia bacterium]
MRTFIIAEAGVNHNGSFELAKRMIDEAFLARVDAIKFQTFNADLTITKSAKKALYQLEGTDVNETQYQMAKNLELSYDSFKKLNDYCKFIGIEFLSTPFDLPSVDFLNSINMRVFKIASGEITNLLLLKKIGSLKKEVILSTGMSEMKEIESAINILVKAGTPKKKITVLHCNTEYPTPMYDVNLKAMITIKDKLCVKIGYSDHTSGIEIPIAAVAMGAEVIEKHFTLDKNMEGPDHKASLSPNELKIMVESIRNVEKALGNGVKKPSVSEIKNITVARKSIYAASFIRKGEVFTDKNIIIKRPGIGISPMHWDDIIGREAGRDFQEDEIIEI